MTLPRYLLLFSISILLASSLNAADIPFKTYSSDNRLMSNILTAGVLDNGLVLYAWEWNDDAKAIDPKYGASKEDGEHLSAGLIAQDVQAKYPNAVFVGSNGYLVIDLSVLARKDKSISDIFMEGKCKSCQQFFNEWWHHTESRRSLK